MGCGWWRGGEVNRSSSRGGPESRTDSAWTGSGYCPARRSLLVAPRFPVVGRREITAEGSGWSRNPTLWRLPDPRIRPISLHFCCRSANWRQRRVRPRLPPPPASLRLRGSLSRGASPQGNSDRFAGFWGGRPQGAEPETGDLPRGSPLERRSSPTALRAVRNEGCALSFLSGRVPAESDRRCVLGVPRLDRSLI
jgi:hypothetical protein